MHIFGLLRVFLLLTSFIIQQQYPHEMQLPTNRTNIHKSITFENKGLELYENHQIVIKNKNI